MARVIGGPALSGAIGNVVFYQMNGKTYCRQKPYISPSSIKKSPTRRRQRETMREFGYASHIGLVLRHKWNSSSANAMGPSISQKLTAQIVKIVRNSSGMPGERYTEISKHGKSLNGFEFHAGRNPNAHFSHTPECQLLTQSHLENHAHTPTHADAKNQFTLQFPSKTHHNAKKAHSEATHYIIHLNVTQIPDYYTDPDNPKRQYPADWKQEPITTNAQSAPIPIGQKPGADGTLRVTLPTPNNVETSHIIAYGIEYVTQNGDQYEHIIISKPRARKRQNDAYMAILDVNPSETIEPKPTKNPKGRSSANGFQQQYVADNSPKQKDQGENQHYPKDKTQSQVPKQPKTAETGISIRPVTQNSPQIPPPATNPKSPDKASETENHGYPGPPKGAAKTRNIKRSG